MPKQLTVVPNTKILMPGLGSCCMVHLTALLAKLLDEHLCPFYTNTWLALTKTEHMIDSFSFPQLLSLK